MSIVLEFLVKAISTDLAKTLIALVINKLLAHAEDGITKDVAVTMIEGISKSQANPTTEDIFKDALTLLKG